LTPLGLVVITIKLVGELEQRIDQGLAATLMDSINNMDD
jgi:hypothetical protein